MACGKMRGKEELVLLVALAEEGVGVDVSGKSPGRGAYVCREGECTIDSLQKEKVDSALRRSTTQQEWLALISLIRNVTATR